MNEPDWHSYHVFYHGDRDVVLRQLVTPVLETLWREAWIDSFFFIRYSLGGPHIRLRLLPRRGCGDAVAETLERAAASFFSACPSTAPRSEEEIRRESRAILANDPHEQDGGVYPDNTLLRSPLRFETERYGGPELLPVSLDFFALSSAQALAFLARHGGQPAPRRLAEVFRLLAGQALGLAGCPEELFDIFDYALRFSPHLAAIADRGDRVYEQRSETFCELLRAEIGAISAVGDSPVPFGSAWGTECARRLAQETAAVSAEVRRRIYGSQIHMTANRLGLLNPDEVYLGRLLRRAARDLSAEPALRGLLAGRPAALRGADASLRDLLRPTLAALFPVVGVPWQASKEESGHV